MDFQEDFENCKSFLCHGYTSTNSSGIPWLNNFCAEFLKCCNKLHKYLVFECCGNEKESVTEIIFLCLNQIICCIKYLEKTIKTEQISKVVLAASRQHFLDRMVWCFARLKSKVCPDVMDDICPTSLEETNFVQVMDEALELISSYSVYKENGQNPSNNAEFEAQVMLISKKLRTSIDAILSQTLAFANVALPRDKLALSALCQKVLRECIAFQDQCSSKPANNSSNTDQNRQLNAIMLENALFKLEDFINESLLRLVYKIFIDYSQHSIDHLRDLIKINPDDPLVDDKVADFDCNVDRIMQVGMFALAFAPNIRIKTIVRSALASIESLDSFLIPSLYARCDLHSMLLEEHFHEEMLKFQQSIQDIIDTNAFCTSFIEILNETIQQTDKKFDKSLVTETLEMAKILKKHLILNNTELQINHEPDKTIQYQNFILMLDESQAILSCADQVSTSRITKRLKILRTCIKKLHKSIVKTAGTGTSKTEYNNDNEVFVMSENLSEDPEKMFESCGISPSIANILYKSTRERRNTTISLIGHTSQAQAKSSISEDSESMKSWGEKKNVKRKVSLRTAMFKRQKSHETEHLYKIYHENSTNLQITGTDILDQLTSLSSTFTNITQTSNGCADT